MVQYKVLKRTIQIKHASIELTGELMIPPEARGIVLFAHGSGSGRHSPRNQFVAQKLSEGMQATLLMDLLTEEEELIDKDTAEFRFDVNLLANRLKIVTQWVANSRETRDLNLGYFGASTGAAAALIAAANPSLNVKAIVSRGGRPDLALDYLSKIQAPTLLIVGGSDVQVIKLNQIALERINVEKRLEIVPNTGHLFEEPGALEKVAELSLNWFKERL